MSQSKRVLVVDDEEAIRISMAEVLEDEGYTVSTACNGAEALTVFPVAQPNAIVLDLMMPVLDGWGFLQACRQQATCAETPVLVISAYRKLSEAATTELRVERFLSKPFELEELVEAVAQLTN